MYLIVLLSPREFLNIQYVFEESLKTDPQNHKDLRLEYLEEQRLINWPPHFINDSLIAW